MSDIDADLYRAAHEREKNGHEEWIEAVLEEAGILYRKRYDTGNNDHTFHDWLMENGVNDLHNKNDRAALIGLGENLNLARDVLQKTTSTSLQLIWKEEAAAQFPSVRKLRSGEIQNNKTRQEKAEILRQEMEAYVKDLGDEGITGPALEEAFNVKHSRCLTELRANGILVPNGTRRKTGNGSATSEVLVHREFAPYKKAAKKRRSPTTTLDRFSIPIVPSLPVLTDEERGAPPADAPTEQHLAYLHKYGHGQPLPIKQRDLMEARKQAVRLAPELRDLGKVLKASKTALLTFLRVPQEQRDPIVPMPADEFALAVLEVDDGTYIRDKVIRMLEEITPDLDAFNEHVDIVNGYVKALKAALAVSPSTLDEAIAQAAQATKQ